MTRRELRRARKELGLTQEELGGLLGLSGRSVLRREKGEVKITASETVVVRMLLMAQKASASLAPVFLI